MKVIFKGRVVEAIRFDGTLKQAESITVETQERVWPVHDQDNRFVNLMETETGDLIKLDQWVLWDKKTVQVVSDSAFKKHRRPLTKLDCLDIGA
jgi:hypothetical protein